MKKNLSIAILAIIGIYGFWVGYLWKLPRTKSVGSYTSAETWVFKVKEHDLINTIYKVKKEHPELEPPHAAYPTSGSNGYWYYFIFYYDDTKENVSTWVRGNEDSTYTTFAFISLASHIDSLTPISEINIDTKDINRDFNYFRNRVEIEKFETRIVNLIKNKIEMEQSKYQ